MSVRVLHAVWAALLGFTLLIVLVSANEPKLTAEELLKRGDAAISQGKYDEAIIHFSDAINADSSSPQPFWKRAVAYLQKQRYREALSDLNQVISLNPQSVPALLRRAKIYRDMGRFADAKNDLSEVLKQRPGDKEAQQLKEGIDQADHHLQEGKRMFSGQRWRDAIHSFTKAIELASVVEEGRLMRAKASLKVREYNTAIDDTSALLKSRKNNLEAIYVRSKAFLYLGDIDVALNHLRECVRLDPDFAACIKENKKLRAFQKSLQSAEDVLRNGGGSAASQALANLENCFTYDPEWVFILPKLNLLKCKALVQLRQPDKALDACQEALKHDGNLQEAHILRSEAFLQQEEFDKAVQEAQRAVDMDQNNQQARQQLFNAQKQLKMSKRKDHYKTLGVPKTATDREIKKAYRKLALQWHPDKHGPDTIQEAQTKFGEINEANEILSDPQKRARYDNGEDLDEQQHGGQQNPFGFGFPGGFQFHFGGRHG